jgi:hypothetical protein
VEQAPNAGASVEAEAGNEDTVASAETTESPEEKTRKG